VPGPLSAHTTSIYRMVISLRDNLLPLTHLSLLEFFVVEEILISLNFNIIEIYRFISTLLKTIHPRNGPSAQRKFFHIQRNSPNNPMKDRRQI
jgi:hypothetical protein